MQLPESVWAHLAAAIGIGLMIGVERERRKEQGPLRVSAGIRTFTITSMLGASAMLVGGEALVIALALAVGALVAVAYWRSGAQDPGVTTGISLLLTLILGGLSMHHVAMAAALAVALTVLLISKSRMHNFVRKVISDSEINDALLLAGATLVVLPLIPDQYMGPFNAFNPRTTWTIVILMMAVGAAGHVAQRLLGHGIGLAASGLASGFVSSAATIGAMGERASRTPELMHPAVAGAMLSTVATVLQMAVMLGATSWPTLQAMSLPLLAAGVAIAGYAAFFTFQTIKAPAPVVAETGHAFSIKTALGLALMVSAVTVLAAALQAWYGQTGLWLGVALAGFADTHSAAVSVASLVASGKLPAADAAIPILCALTANTITKVVVSVAVGSRRYATLTIPGLVLFIAAAWIASAAVAR